MLSNCYLTLQNSLKLSMYMSNKVPHFQEKLWEKQEQANALDIQRHNLWK